MRPSRFRFFLLTAALGLVGEFTSAAASSCDPGFNCLERAHLYVSTHISYRWDVEAGRLPYDPFYYSPEADNTLELITPYYSSQPNGGLPRSDVRNCRLVIAGDQYPARPSLNRKVSYYDDSLGFLAQSGSQDPRFLIRTEQMEVIRDLRANRVSQQTDVYMECAPINGFMEYEKFYVDVLGDYTPPMDYLY